MASLAEIFTYHVIYAVACIIICFFPKW